MNEREYRDTLPENAFRELRESEEYEPMMPAEGNPRVPRLQSRLGASASKKSICGRTTLFLHFTFFTFCFSLCINNEAPVITTDASHAS